MKLPSRLFAASALLAAVQMFAFEGKISLALTAGRSDSMNMDYSFKGQKVRTDINAGGQQMGTITDLTRMETIMLIPQMNKYMVMSLKQPIEKAMKNQDTANPDIEITGKTETILGYKCSQMLVKDKGTVTELWVAEGLGAFTGMGQGGNPMGGMFGGGKSPQAAKWEEALKGKGGFPLRVISRDSKGKETLRMEATKIEAGSLPDSLFAPPAGYEKFSMPGMGGMN